MAARGKKGAPADPAAALPAGDLPVTDCGLIRAAERNAQRRTPVENEIAATDRRIDALVYPLYGLSDEEVAVVDRYLEHVNLPGNAPLPHAKYAAARQLAPAPAPVRQLPRAA